MEGTKRLWPGSPPGGGGYGGGIGGGVVLAWSLRRFDLVARRQQRPRPRGRERGLGSLLETSRRDAGMEEGGYLAWELDGSWIRTCFASPLALCIFDFISLALP